MALNNAHPARHTTVACAVLLVVQRRRNPSQRAPPGAGQDGGRTSQLSEPASVKPVRHYTLALNCCHSFFSLLAPLLPSCSFSFFLLLAILCSTVQYLPRSLSKCSTVQYIVVRYCNVWIQLVPRRTGLVQYCTVKLWGSGE